MTQLSEANCSAKADARLIALDWGTSSLRAMLLGEDAALLDARVAPLGIMQIGEGGFEAAYRSVVADWLAEAQLPAIAAGMVGSAQGWLEAPYCQGAAGARELAGRLAYVALSDGGVLHLVPGVSQTEPRAEVMRGEETQVVGALTLFLQMRREAVFVLPGTHSKWIRIEDGCILECQTFMTGELFAVLRQHSILGRFADTGEPEGVAAEEADNAFDTGVEVARRAAVEQIEPFGPRAKTGEGACILVPSTQHGLQSVVKAGGAAPLRRRRARLGDACEHRYHDWVHRCRDEAAATEDRIVEIWRDDRERSLDLRRRHDGPSDGVV